MTCQGGRNHPSTKDLKAHQLTSRRTKRKLSLNSLQQYTDSCGSLFYLCPQLIPMNPATMY